MAEPMVSVLMPNHNGGRFLAKSIESVLNQTFQDFELIVVEDGSTDDSAAILGRYQNPRIRVISLEQNEHICYAMNTGLQQARGTYIARLDSDDCWMPDKLEKQIGYMLSHPECGASFTWVEVVDEEERVLSQAESPFVDLFHAENRSREQWLHDFFFRGSCLCHPTAVFPRAVALEMQGYRTSLVQLQDYELWIRIAKKYPLHILQEPLIRYRHCLQGGNISARSHGNNVRSFYEFYSVLSTYLDDLSDPELTAVFQNDFSLPTASTHEELLCERALLLLKTDFTGHAGKLAGMDKLCQLVDCEQTRLVLRQRYGITQLNLYELTKSNALLVEQPDTALYQLTSVYGTDLGFAQMVVNQLSRRQFCKLAAHRFLPAWVVSGAGKLYRAMKGAVCRLLPGVKRG